ncbi:MAG: ribosome maturation factor RimM [Rickettsiaceae bacterium]
MEQESKLILVGVISAAHGIKGEVLIKSYTTPKENILSLSIINSQQEPVKLKKIRTKGNESFVCKIDLCTDRNKAESLKGTQLFCLRSSLPELLEEEYYFNDLKGLEVLDEHNNKVGVVTNVANFGAGDILEIKFNNDKEEMLPFTKEVFPKITKDYIVLCDKRS